MVSTWRLARCLVGGLLALVGFLLMVPGYVVSLLGQWILPSERQAPIDVLTTELPPPREQTRGLDLSRVSLPTRARVLPIDPRQRARAWPWRPPTEFERRRGTIPPDPLDHTWGIRGDE